MATKARFILTKDVHGFKPDGKLKSAIKKYTVGIHPFPTVNVLRGELVEQHEQRHLHCNMRLCRDPAIYMFTQEKYVAPLYSEEDFNLLLGIENISDRFSTFKNYGIVFGTSLIEGSKVLVRIFGPGHIKTKMVMSTVRYKGKVEGLQGTQFGVELMEGKRDISGSDGTFRGMRYFTCEDGFGMFVSLNKLSAYPDSKSARQGSNSSPEEPRQHVTFHAKGGGVGDAPGVSNTKTETTLASHHLIFRIGENVSFHDRQGRKHFGTVKWIGNSTKTRKYNYTVVGMQTDDTICLTDFENSVPGLTQYISAPKNHCLFLPEAMVEKLKGNDKLLFQGDIRSTAASKSKPFKEDLLQEHEQIRQDVKRVKKLKDSQKVVEAVYRTGEDVTPHFEELHKMKASQAEKRRQQELHGFQGKKSGSIQYNASEHRNILQESRSLEQYHGSHTSASDFTKAQLTSSGLEIFASSGEGPTNRFDIGSMVQIPTNTKNTPYRYGVIKWIGNLPKVSLEVAGIELKKYYFYTFYILRGSNATRTVYDASIRAPLVWKTAFENIFACIPKTTNRNNETIPPL